MRGKVLVASLALLLAGSSVGCKTTSNMAWWRTAGKDAPEAEVLARSAPELPSEIAKQAEGLAANTSEQLAGGVAAPFVPGGNALPAADVAATTAPGAYPSTSAPSFTPTTPAATTAPATASLGSLAMPYNPNAVPPAAATTTPVAAPPGASRYASVATSPATPSNNAALPAASYPDTPSRYGQQVASAATATTDTPQTSTPPSTQTAALPTTASGAAAKLGDRYAAVVPSASLPVNNSLAEPATPTIPPKTTLTEAAPFRPGGTSTYPAAVQAPVQVATRPETPTTAMSHTPNTTPTTDGSLPAAHTPPHQVPRYR